MEQQLIRQNIQFESKPFIEANTLAINLSEVNEEHIIPVFTKDNTPLISHAQFVETLQDVLNNEHQFSDYEISSPEMRVSHPVKGRIPSARNKAAIELLPHEKTIYYQRMMFILRIKHSISLVNHQPVEIIVGGIKAYNKDKLNSRQAGVQNFKLFIGLQVKVCCNLCIWTDGAKLDLTVRSLQELGMNISTFIEDYRSRDQIDSMTRLKNYALTEEQFANFIGRCRMYHSLEYKRKKQLPQLLLSDTQLSHVTQNYWSDENFGVDNGYLNLWSLYNLMTAACKSSYIDNALERNINASQIATDLSHCLDGKSYWLLNT